MIQYNVFTKSLHLIYDPTGETLGEINGKELKIYSKGTTIYQSQDQAINEGKKFLISYQPEIKTDKNINPNQISLF